MAPQDPIPSPLCSKEDDLKAKEQFLRELHQALLAEPQLLASSPTILVACSGGADSMALLLGLHALSEGLNFTLAVGTVDHGLRAGAQEDADFVASRAAQLNIPCSVAHLNLGENPGGATGKGIEAWAREKRYEALRQMASTFGASVIATAHTLDDQAETLLLRLCSGCGIRGARGVLQRSKEVFRPMLQIRRATLLGFLRAQNEQYRTDPTNECRAFSRNRLRLDVFPALEKALGPTAIEGLARFCAIAKITEDCLEEMAQEAEDKLICGDDLAFDGLFDAPAGGKEGVQGGDQVIISSEFSTESLCRLPEALRHRVLERAVLRAGGQLDFATFERLNLALDKLCPQKLQIHGGVTATVRYGRLTLGREKKVTRTTFKPDCPPFFEEKCLRLPTLHALKACPQGRWSTTWRGMDVSVALVSEGEHIRSGSVCIPKHMVEESEGLVLRTRQCADTFRPRGMGGAKKLQDFFVDAKIPREIRDLIPLLACTTGPILAILGIRDGENVTHDVPPEGGVEISLSPLPFEVRVLGRGK